LLPLDYHLEHGVSKVQMAVLRICRNMQWTKHSLSPRGSFISIANHDILTAIAKAAITYWHRRNYVINCKNSKVRRMAFSGMIHRVALVWSDVSEELSPSIIRVTRIREIGTTLTVTSNRRALLRNATRGFRLCPSSGIEN
jgi:hypothetical protein